MLKTWKQVKAQRKDSHRVPFSVQDTVPVRTVWEDGTFYHGGNLYSRCYRFTDINYFIVDPEQRMELYEKFQHLLAAMGGGATYKITTYKRKMDMAAWEEEMLLPMQENGLDVLVDNYNGMLRQDIAAADGRSKEMFLTVTVWRPTLEEARNYFNRSFLTIQRSLSALGSRVVQMDAVERLRICHDFFRPGNESRFDFRFDDSVRRGHDFRDAICPESIEIHSSYLKLGKRFARALICIEYAPRVTDELMDKLTEVAQDMVVSVDVVNIPTDEAQSEAQSKLDGVEGSISRWQQRQNNSNNFSAMIPYPIQRQREEMHTFLDELSISGQGMHKVTMTLIHTAPTLEQLNADTERLQALRECKLFPATFQQLPGLVTALPYGVCRIQSARTLLTRCLAATAMPFKAQEIQQPDGIYIGHNTLTLNPIVCDFSTLLNQGMFIVGVPGSGKSMMAKLLLFAIAVRTGDAIIINDPEGEYAPLVKRLGGSVIRIEAGGPDHINTLDMAQGYGLKDARTEKAQFHQSLLERMQDAPLSAQERSILDRCVRNVYANAASGGTPTLTTLREELMRQKEPEAMKMALTLEQYTVGSLDMFAHETNVDISNRILCFDMHEMRKELRPIGQLVIADTTTNLVNNNSRSGRCTHVFTDEIQEFYKNESSAKFCDNAWRQWRKRNSYPTGITQNAAVMLRNDEAQTMLSNSECIIMLNQSDADREALRKHLQLSETQMEFVRGSEPGSGLLRYGSRIVPFSNKFPRETELYKLISTRPGDGYTGGEAL